MKSVLVVFLLLVSDVLATTNYVVQVSQDGTQTIPANTLATPTQVTNATVAAASAGATAQALWQRSTLLAERMQAYATNAVVTSTVYVQSIGGVPYDPSNQTITVRSLSIVNGTNVAIVATVRQAPLVTPKLDWRYALNSGAWSNVAATVSEVAIPNGVTNAAKAYQFVLPKPGSGKQAFFRVEDNSSGASGSGLWWVVFGGIRVDGRNGWTGAITNGAAVYPFKGGALVEPVPL